MEAVLRIQELSNAILQNLTVLPPNDHQIRGVEPDHLSRDDLVSDKERRQALYHMALTNRTMSQLALPLLWNTVEGISPLLRLIPGLEYNEFLKAWILLRPLLAEDFDRFEIYAQMVRHIALPPKDRLHLHRPPHSSTLLEICLVRRMKPLFPSLQTLYVDDCCDHAGILLTDTLKCLKIIRPDRSMPRHEPKAAVWNLLTLLPTRVPRLEELYIGCAPSSSNLADILKLESLQKLTFDLDSVTHWPVNEQARYQFFKRLESLPKLRELDIGNLLEDHRSRISPFLDPNATISYNFSALEKLSFRGFDDYLTKILIRFPGTIPLKCLSVRLEEGVMWSGLDDEEDEDEEEIEEIVQFDVCKAFPILGERYSHSLTKLEIDSSLHRFDPGDLDSLFRITGMQHLDFGYTTNSGVDDQLIFKMAPAWPQLEFFRLFTQAEFGIPTPSYPTLASIQTFAIHCPNLRRLALDLDPTVIRLSDFDTIYPLKHLTLFSIIDDGNLGEHNVPAVARFMAKCFPALIFAFVEFSRQTDEQGEGNWSAVFRRLLRDRDSEELGRIRRLLQLQVFGG